MRLMVTTAAIGFVLMGSLHAQQDSTSTTRSRVETDDARAVVATGCLMQLPGTTVFSLRGAITATGDDLTTRSRTRTDVDKDDTSVKTETQTRVDRDDRPVGTSGTVTTYELSPRAGVELSTHVGKRVELSAVVVDAKNGDDDAEIEIEEKTEVERDDAPDSKAKSETELEVPRGANAKLAVISVKQIAASCN